MAFREQLEPSGVVLVVRVEVLITGEWASQMMADVDHLLPEISSLDCREQRRSVVVQRLASAHPADDHPLDGPDERPFPPTMAPSADGRSGDRRPGIRSGDKHEL